MAELLRKNEASPEQPRVDVDAPVEQRAEDHEVASPAPVETPSPLHEGAEPAAPVSLPAPAESVATAAPAKDPLSEAIEGVLEEDLGEVYGHMDPETQKVFRAKGEEVAGRLRVMMAGAKLSLRKVIGMIRGWLQMIPGVNKFFLEQEAKIKTDKIHELARRNNVH
ncbi:hypothetical protein HYW18_03405 [Candidatus Uhrbacteria bacterium]|nr:hypothetical protein [Candidatus Uhrbacteria bacterium]